MSKNVDNLLDYRFDKYSDLGVDGIVEYIFNTIGIKKGLFVEFGAWDGIYGSNCRKLFEEGWDGIFIESDPDRYKALYNNYCNFENIFCIESKIGLEKKYFFDNIIRKYVKNNVINFCSIDIDGLDLEVFETFSDYMPICICIEGGANASSIS